MNEQRYSEFLQVTRDLAVGRGLNTLCSSLASGLIRTGLDRCEVVIGVEYKEGKLAVGQCLAVDDIDPALRDKSLQARCDLDGYPAIQGAVQSQEPLWSNDVAADERFFEDERTFLADLKVQSILVAPMISQGHTVGYILAGKREKGGFDPERALLYQAIVGHAAAAIETTRTVSMMEGWTEAQTREVATFKALAENATDAICMATLHDHKLIYANPAFYDLHGFRHDDDVLGRVEDSFAIYDDAEATTTTQITRLGGLRRECEHTRKDGTTFTGLDTVFAVRDERGEVFALGNIIRNVSRQKELERRLQDLSDLRTWRLEVITEIAQEISTAPEMEELFHRVVTLVKERFAYYHTHLYLLRNGVLEMVEGYGEPGRIMRERGHRIQVGSGLTGTAAEIGKPVLAPNVSQIENWLPNPLLPDTKSEVAVPIKMGDQVLGVLDVQSDQLNGLTEDDQTLLLGLCGQIAVAIQNAQIVSNIQQLVDERTREVAIFQALAENATYGLLMTTPGGEVTYANRANHEIFGYEFTQQRREMIGLPITQIFAPTTIEQFEDEMPKVLAGKSWQVESDGLRKDSSTVSLLMLTFGILDDSGNPLAIVYINRDVTEQKQLEAERERLNREMITARERLISELSAPLIPITRNILVLPLIGAVDSARAQQIMESLLSGIEGYNAEVVIVDVTGVPLMDTGVANHLLQMTDAASLVGARVILVGITPRVAQTIIELGVDLSAITTRSNLQGGVEYALRLQGQHITSIG
jgi:PAS domain S-box-containing protein